MKQSFFLNFIYFCLCWVFIAARGLSLVVVSRSYSSLRCAGSSLWWLLAFFFLNFILFIFLYSRFLFVIYFIHISVYMSIPISQFIPPPPPHPPPLPPLGVYTFVLYIFVSISALQTVYLYHFCRFDIYALIYNICFSLSDLLHSV